MKNRLAYGLLAVVLSTGASADSLTANAALGGGLGGALGAFVGSEIGGTSGAIVGGAIGGATGSAIATNGYRRERVVVRPVRPVVAERYYVYDDDYRYGHRSHFCPPGQAKKGRC
jgi:hypothetical protein